jgi:hypothetical protein
MSEEQFEENLNYGDNVNFVGRIRDIFVSIAELKKELTKE